MKIDIIFFFYCKKYHLRIFKSVLENIHYFYFLIVTQKKIQIYYLQVVVKTNFHNMEREIRKFQILVIDVYFFWTPILFIYHVVIWTL